MGKPYANKKVVSAPLEFEQVRRLRELSERTRVPQAVYLREAVEDLLDKYARKRK